MAVTVRDSKKRYSAWDEFDPKEYVSTNYNTQLSEDKLICKKVIERLKELGVKSEQWIFAADIGAGPNLYPAMLLSPCVKPVQDGGRLDLIEFSEPNRYFLQDVLSQKDLTNSRLLPWLQFEEFMANEDKSWKGTLKDVQRKSKVKAGSIFDLKKEVFDAVSLYFVAESITDDIETCKKAIISLVDSLKPGGFLSVAHMLGSQGYTAGRSTNFPAVSVTLEDLQDIYKDYPGFIVEQINASPEARAGYHGMALVTGIKS